MSIKLRNIVIDYGNSIAVDNLSMSIKTGELVCLLGPSGCGKSTTLNAIAGLLQVSQGQILFDGVDVTKKSPQKRNIGLVFQNYALYPHLNVFQNIAFPLKQNDDFQREIEKNNKLVKLEIKTAYRMGVSKASRKLKSKIEAELEKYVNLYSKEFYLMESDFVAMFKALADKYALAIYGDKELNNFRSRLFTMWFDEFRQWIELQKEEMYNEIISNLKSQSGEFKAALVSAHIKDDDFVKFLIQQFLQKLKIEKLDLFKRKAKAIGASVAQHKKILIEDVKSFRRLSAISGKDVKWLVTTEERDALIAEYESEAQALKEVFASQYDEIINQKLAKLKIIEKFLKHYEVAINDFAIDEKMTEAESENELAILNSKIKKYKLEIKKAVLEVAKKVEIESQLKKRPAELSGGQQQRVAIARAIVKKPKVLLLDEPLSNLDAKLRVSTREWIKKFQKDTGITTVFVTHDQEEAMSISDKIFIMNKGLLQQADAPMSVYEQPANKFVANFIGTPSMNFFDNAKVDEQRNVILNDQKIGKLKSKTKAKKIVVGVRPEHININGDLNFSEFANKKPFIGIVDVIEKLGRSDYMKFIWDKREVRVIYDGQTGINANESIKFNIQKGKVYIFDNAGDKPLLEVI